MPRYTPRYTAAVILAKIDSGKLRSRGAWVDLLWHLERLPQRMKEGVWSWIEDRLGTDAVQYMREWARSVDGKRGEWR